MNYGFHRQGKTFLQATGSATLIAAVSGARLHITEGCISVDGGAAAGEVQLIETYATGTSILQCLKIHASTEGVHNINFGDKGFALSAIGSRIALVVSGGNASVSAAMRGYSR